MCHSQAGATSCKSGRMKQQRQEKEARTIAEGRGSPDSDMHPEIAFK